MPDPDTNLSPAMTSETSTIFEKKVVKYNDHGMPFITADNRATLYCKHGADQNVKTKAEYTESVQS